MTTLTQKFNNNTIFRKSIKSQINACIHIGRPTEARCIFSGLPDVAQNFLCLLNVCFAQLCIHLFTSARIHLFDFFFNLLFDDVLVSGREGCRSSWSASVPCSMFLCWCLFLLEAVPFCFLSGLFFVALFVFLVLTSSPFRTGSHEQLDFFCNPSSIFV